MAGQAMKMRVVVACFALLVARARAGTAGDRQDDLSIHAGFATSFSLSGADPRGLRPVRVRGSKIGPVDAKPGEITVGLAPPGGAVGIAKLHVFERTPNVVSFSVVATRDGKRLAGENVCGHLNLDTWIALPADTSLAVIDHFVEGDCK